MSFTLKTSRSTRSGWKFSLGRAFSKSSMLIESRTNFVGSGAMNSTSVSLYRGSKGFDGNRVVVNLTHYDFEPCISPLVRLNSGLLRPT
jgi:hypothetical protein